MRLAYDRCTSSTTLSSSCNGNPRDPDRLRNLINARTLHRTIGVAPGLWSQIDPLAANPVRSAEALGRRALQTAEAWRLLKELSHKAPYAARRGSMFGNTCERRRTKKAANRARLPANMTAVGPYISPAKASQLIPRERALLRADFKYRSLARPQTDAGRPMAKTKRAALYAGGLTPNTSESCQFRP